MRNRQHLKRDQAPSVIMMAMTEAKIGRSMKNRDMAAYFAAGAAALASAGDCGLTATPGRT